MSRALAQSHLEVLFGAMGAGKSTYLAWRLLQIAESTGATIVVFSPDDRLPDTLPDGTKIRKWVAKDGDALESHLKFPTARMHVYVGDNWRDFRNVTKLESERRKKSILMRRKPLAIGIDEAVSVRGLSGASGEILRQFASWLTSARWLRNHVVFSTQVPTLAGVRMLGLLSSMSFFLIKGADAKRYFESRFGVEFEIDPRQLRIREVLQYYFDDAPDTAQTAYPYNKLREKDGSPFAPTLIGDRELVAPSVVRRIAKRYGVDEWELSAKLDLWAEGDDTRRFFRKSEVEALALDLRNEES